MKKLTRILALTLCCLLAAGLAACGETPAPHARSRFRCGNRREHPDPEPESPL